MATTEQPRKRWNPRAKPLLSPTEVETYARALLDVPDLDDDDRHQLRMAISAARIHQNGHVILGWPRAKGGGIGPAADDVIDIWTRCYGSSPISAQARPEQSN